MMAFGRGQLDKFAAAVEKVIGNGQVPKAILLSGGGNDIAGAEFGFLINHAGSPKQGFNDSVVRGVIDERVRDAYVWIIRTITALCKKMIGQEVRIILHGYGYPVPDGVGVVARDSTDSARSPARGCAPVSSRRGSTISRRTRR